MSTPLEFPFPLGGDVEANAETDGATRRLAQYIKGKPNMEALLDAIGVQGEELLEVLSQLDLDRRLADAFGDQLDLFGAIVGEAREGEGDDAYRARLQARIKLNTASGTPEEILEIFGLIKPSGTSLELRDEFPAGFTLLIGTEAITSTAAALLLKFLRLARAAGVRGILEWVESDPSEVFTFDGTGAQALDNGNFAGSAH